MISVASDQPAAEPRIMDETDDMALLQAIARDRDRAAFAELFKRHRQASFSLAFSILHDRTLAEDTVQEAMLSVWQSAELFRPEGKVAKWILGIVAKQSLMFIRSAKRRSTRERRTVDMQPIKSESEAETAVDRDELAQALRAKIEKLPELERQLLACCFGVGLAHEEICEIVGVSRSTISRKIQEVLERLRGELLKDGFASALPMLTPKLCDAIRNGYECPPGMQERMMLRFSEANSAVADSARTANEISRRVVAAKPMGLWWVAAGTAGALALAGGLWSALHQTLPPALPASRPDEPAPAALALPAEQPAPNEQPKPFHARWSFEKGPSDVFVLMGRWTWNRQPDGKGCVEAPVDYAVFIGFPIRVPQGPLKIEITKSGIGRTGIISTDAIWLEKGQALRYKQYTMRRKIGAGVTTTEIYLSGPYVVTMEGGQVSSVYCYERPAPFGDLCLALQNFSIFSIEIKSVETAEIPEQLRDMEGLIRASGVVAAEGSHSEKFYPRRSNLESDKTEEPKK